MDTSGSHKQTALAYLQCLETHDGERLASLFTDNGIIDDGGGGHTEGRDALRAFGDSRPLGIEIGEPAAWLSGGEHRLTAYGRITVPGYSTYPNATSTDDTVRLRWIFHFDGDLIAHVSVSSVRLLPDETAQAQQATASSD